jgi:hypothetical protein
MKIPLDLHDPILAMVGAGKSTAAVASWLQSAKGITVTRQAVDKIVKRARSTRADTSKLIAREHIARTLPTDLDTFDRHMARTSELLELAQAEALKDLTVANVEKVTKLTAAWARLDESKKKAMGLDQPDEVVTSLADLLAKA